MVLVLGDVQNASAGDNNVPPAARKALGDMKDFLPYKSYRLLDAQWILGSQRTVSRLRGANDQEYELTLRGVAIAGGKLSVNFRLADPGPIVGVRPAADADSRAGRRASLEDALRAAEAEAERLRTSSGEKRAETVAASREKIAAIQKELEQEKALRDAASRLGGRSIIDTSRRCATRNPATCELSSRAMRAGRRERRVHMSTTSSRITPPSTSFTGGVNEASVHTSDASWMNPPGCEPPSSRWWTQL